MTLMWVGVVVAAGLVTGFVGGILLVIRADNRWLDEYGPRLEDEDQV